MKQEKKNSMSENKLANLDGWGEEYEQIRKMLELNKRKSEEKVERAVLTIRTMVLEREKGVRTSTYAKDWFI